MTHILRRAAVAGALGGLALALVLRLVGEGPLGAAVAREHAHDQMFSRGTQQVGGMVGSVLFGVCMGVLLGVVYALTTRRPRRLDAWTRSVALAVGAFVTVALVPALKYPANPPGVGSPDDIGRRTALYLVMLAWSAVCTWAAWTTWQRARRRWPVATAAPVTAAVYLGLVVAALVLLPGTDVPVALPAEIVWHFRLASITGAAALWGITGLALGALVARDARG